MVLGSSSQFLDRNHDIYRGYLDGESYRDLAERNGIGVERVKQIVARERSNARIARHKGEGTYLGRSIPEGI